MHWRNPLCYFAVTPVLGLMLGASGCVRNYPKGAVAARAAASPLLGVLDQFTAPDVPAKGPAEANPIPHTWQEPSSVPEWPGNGLAQHSMLYAGEGYNTLFLVNHGKVVWTIPSGRAARSTMSGSSATGTSSLRVSFTSRRSRPKRMSYGTTILRRAPKCTVASPSDWTKSCWCKTACRPN